MSNTSVPTSFLTDLANGSLTASSIMTKAKGFLTPPNRTVIKVNGSTVDCGPTAKGVAWFSYAKLGTLGLRSTYRCVANGRFLPITDGGMIVPGFSWKGSAVITVNHARVAK